MSIYSSQEPRSHETSVREIVLHVARSRSSGVEVRDEQILAKHPDIADELQAELQKVYRIGTALEQADDQNYLAAWQRIQACEPGAPRSDRAPDVAGRPTAPRNASIQSLRRPRLTPRSQ